MISNSQKYASIEPIEKYVRFCNDTVYVAICDVFCMSYFKKK